jgi:hypothetical protein
MDCLRRLLETEDAMTPNPPLHLTDSQPIRLSRTVSGDGLPDVELPRVETRPYHFDPPQSVDVHQLRAAEHRARVAEQQLAAHQGVAAGLQEQLTKVMALLAVERAENRTTQRLYLAELRESFRLAKMHAEVSAQHAWVLHMSHQVSLDNVYLRHQIAGSTPAAVQVALRRAEQAVENDDTMVIEMPVGGVR